MPGGGVAARAQCKNAPAPGSERGRLQARAKGLRGSVLETGCTDRVEVHLEGEWHERFVRYRQCSRRGRLAPVSGQRDAGCDGGDRDEADSQGTNGDLLRSKGGVLEELIYY